MAASIQDIVLDGTWKDVNTTTGIAVGTAVVIQNKSFKPMFVWLGATAPTAPDAGIFLQTGEMLQIKAGEPKVWMFGRGKANIQP